MLAPSGNVIKLKKREEKIVISNTEFRISNTELTSKFDIQYWVFDIH